MSEHWSLARNLLQSLVEEATKNPVTSLTQSEHLKRTHCPSSNKWNRRSVLLKESFVPHLHVTRRVGCEFQFKPPRAADTNRDIAFANGNHPGARSFGPRYRPFHEGERRRALGELDLDCSTP